MEYTILILLLPLLSFLFLGLAGMKLKPVVAGAIGTAVLAVVALLSYCTAFEYFSAGRDASGVFPTLVPWNTVWLPISRTLHIDLGILLDPISVMMLVVISTVSLMVHVYSLGYIHDRRKGWYWFFLLTGFAFIILLVCMGVHLFRKDMDKPGNLVGVILNIVLIVILVTVFWDPIFTTFVVLAFVAGTSAAAMS